jgi:acyl carrier protein
MFGGHFAENTMTWRETTEQAKVDSGADPTARLLSIIESLQAELHPHRQRKVTLDSVLDRDLGLDSLGRTELLMRIERAFGASLSEQAAATVETPRDLLRLLRGSDQAVSSCSPAEILDLSQTAAATVPETAATLVEVLQWHAAAHPQRLHVQLYRDAQNQEPISYAALREGAAAMAVGLWNNGLQDGQRVAIMLPTSRDYLQAFFGVLMAGGVPVPLYPPLRAARLEEHLQRRVAALSNAQARFLIAGVEAKPFVRYLRLQVDSLRDVFTAQELSVAQAAEWRAPSLHSQDIALLQYTSGSTGNPKGVVLTHANLLANIRAMGRVTQATPRDVSVSWLPLYHDMGLIGAWLGSLYHGCPLVLMPTQMFLARPQSWLWAIHRHRGTISAAPNFAYELCLSKIEDRHLQGLDLSCWRIALNGAEPVSPKTILGFSERFARYGFRPQAMMPVYGLAECSVGLTFPPLGRMPVIDRIQRAPFETTGRAEPSTADDPSALSFVGCGRPLPGHEIRIVDETGFEVAERQQGRLQFRGPSATSGYFRNAEATRRLFAGDWLDSGDLAYMVGSEVFLTGRAKEIIIRGGRNIHPYELEQSLGNLPELRKGSVAVFGSPDPRSGTERLIVMAETRLDDPQAQEKLRSRINELTMDVVGTPPDDVMLVPPHTVLKTSSGKIRRTACRELYERGGAPRRFTSARWQKARIIGVEWQRRLRRGSRLAHEALFAARVWAFFCLLAPPTWLASVILPRPSWRWAISHLAARVFLRCSGIPCTIHGLEHLPQQGAFVLAANHCSYLDGLLITAILSRPVRFVAKRELLNHLIARLYLQRIGAQFVERFDFQRGREDAARLAQVARGRHALMFFPEGTFTRETGLRPFRMGAFIVAAQAGIPVVPVTIRGSRSVLRDGSWFPRRAPICMVVGQPLVPESDDWAAAVKLRDAVRAEILRGCGEPDLEE